jgi:hypothetical protein
MRRPAVLTVAALLAVALNASAEERKLTGDEIHKLLAGNSVHGMWGQSEYKSYFDPGGATTYHAKGRDPSSGYWRTTATQYCSTWNDHESCYDLFQDGDQIIWLVPDSGNRYPSTLVKGNDTDF